MKKFRESEFGQGIVEFALTLPLLLTILCGILDYGWIYSNKYMVEHAAFEGARFASVYSDQISKGEISVDEVTVQVKKSLPECEVTTVITADYAQVTVKKNIPIFTFVASTFLGSNYDAVSTVTTAIN